ELDLKTDSFKNMYKLKLLYLKSVQLSGSYAYFSKELLWLCWIGFHLKTVPSGLSMRNLVALDMSASFLEVFEISTALQSLKILNLKDSVNLLEIRNIDMMPNLETLILWNCRNLVYVCETIGGLKSLVLLDMTGCENLYKSSWQMKLMYPLKRLTTIFDRGSTQKSSFPMPSSLERLFLKDCKLEYTDFFLLDFSNQSSMQYLNLGNNHFRTLPNFNHLGNLLVLDLSLCSRLECLLCLPSKLAKLYINQCESLERVTFESHRFTLQELVCEGCTNLSEIEGFIKLVPVTKLNVSHLGPMKWLKEYQYHEVCLVGGDEITKNRSQSVVQLLYEFGIMSTSLPEIKIPNEMPQPKSEKTSTSVSFKVPECPNNSRLKGINVTFKYTMFGDDCIWFVKISTTNGVNFIYNPRVFGRPGFGKVGSWLSYWPIGNMLYVRDNVNVSIFVVRGLEVCDCDARLVYTDDDVADKTLENNMGWVETLGGDLSAFQLSKGAYYLCRRDFFDKLEVDKPTPDWFKDLVGGNIDHAGVLLLSSFYICMQLNLSYN
ncbi:putative disease resistance protein isoform X1, partial [Tanacetum coccineum]